MVRQTSERLHTDDIVHALVDQLDHLARQIPAFSGLVALLQDLHRKTLDLTKPSRRGKVFAFLQHLIGLLLDAVDQSQAKTCRHSRLLALAQLLSSVDRTGEAVFQECNHFGHDHFRAFFLQLIRQMLVCKRHVFYKYFAYDTDLRLHDIRTQFD